MKAGEIVKIIHKKFPIKYSSQWDYIGYYSGSARSSVSKVLFTLDISSEVIDYAFVNGFDMIVSHHPLFWGEKQEILEENEVIANIFKKLKKYKITTYSAHTAIDGARDGLNKWSLDLLKVNKIKWLKHDLVQIGLFKKPQSLNKLSKKCKKIFDIKMLITNSKIKKVSSIMMANGSHDHTTVDLAQKNKVDLLISGEMKHSTLLHAQEQGVNVLLVGHYMESIFPQKMAKIFESKLKVGVGEYKQENMVKAI